MKTVLRTGLAIGLLSLAAGLLGPVAQAAEPYVNVTVGGVLSPGVYGRIDIGNAPPPPVYYPQPIIITRPVVVNQPVVVQPVQPVYLYVPPGHQKKWGKHCARYNACGQPVYFVNMAKYQKDRHHEERSDRDDDRGEHHGKGKDKDKDKDKGKNRH